MNNHLPLTQNHASEIVSQFGESSKMISDNDKDSNEPIHFLIDERKQIEITTDEHIVNSDAVASLAYDPDIYQRGGMLVRVARDVSPASKGIRRPFSPRIESLPLPLLREKLAENARWVTTKQNNGEIVVKPAHPPAWCVSAVNARGEWPGIRHLEAVVEYPVLRPDGTILAHNGFDPETGLLLENTCDLGLLHESPSLDDAVAARDLLLSVVSDFPFEKPIHQAAWMAALITPLCRFAFVGPAPLFLVDANVRGAGKGLLLDCISRIVTGERFTVATYTKDEDELRKRITSLALSGERLVLFDNLGGSFGNATLDAALTSSSWEDRLLGGNRMVKAPMLIIWYATGNNVSTSADTARRICHIRLESPCERPEERQDFRKHDLLTWIGKHRSSLLTAALTILRAFVLAGRPNMNLPAWGSFDGWSRLVRSAVVWVGLPDPGETRQQLQESADPTAENMSLLLACMEKMDTEGRGFTANELIEKVKIATMGDFADCRAAIEGLVGKLDSRPLGYKFRNFRRRIFKGRFIDRAGLSHQAMRWRVFKEDEFNRVKDAPNTPHPPLDGGAWEDREDICPQSNFDDTPLPDDWGEI